MFTNKYDTPSVTHFTFLNNKGHAGSETCSNFIQNFYFPNAPIWIKVLCNDCITCQLNKTIPTLKANSKKKARF